MGMVCEIQALTAGQIEALLAEPDLASTIAFGSEGSDGASFDEPLQDQLDLHKSWDILRHLMNKASGQDVSDRTDWSSELLCADLELDGELDLGYGPPYLRSIDETRKFADFLRSMDLDQLLSHVNYAEMAKEEIYGFPKGGPVEDEERDLREDIRDSYPRLRDYVMKAAAADCGLLLWIS